MVYIFQISKIEYGYVIKCKTVGRMLKEVYNGVYFGTYFGLNSKHLTALFCNYFKISFSYKFLTRLWFENGL